MVDHTSKPIVAERLVEVLLKWLKRSNSAGPHASRAGYAPPGVRTILIVDDVPANLEVAREHLERDGYRAVVARGGAEGIERAELVQPDLILLDVMMPGLDGFETCRRLQASAKTRDIPVIFMTGRTDTEAKVAGFDVGAIDYVTKPLNGAEMLARIGAHLTRYALGRQLEEQNAQLQQEIAVREQIQTALAQANARLRQLSAHLVDTQERERTGIARELHDGLGQVLTGIVMQLHAARRSESPVQAAQCRDDALDLAQQAIQQVKSMSFQLRPAQLELLGFIAAVKATLDRQRDATGLKSFVRLRGATPQRVLPTHAVALRILQEGLNNVLRHAAARRLVVRLHFHDGDRFVMTVGDDGCGYDVRAVLAGGISEKNIGLHGMLERAELMGGHLRFRSSIGRGSVLRLSL